jgi:hypothetical protein
VRRSVPAPKVSWLSRSRNKGLQKTLLEKQHKGLWKQNSLDWLTLDGRLGGPQSRSGHGGEEKNSQPPPGIEPRTSDRPALKVSRYIDGAIPALTIYVFPFNLAATTKSAVLLLFVVQLFKKFPAFYGLRKFITVFTRAHHWSLS